MGMRYRAAAVPAEVAETLSVDCEAEAIGELLDGGVDIDKMWHAAQVVISGSIEAQEPLFTGEPIGPDLGFGPARLATPDEVARVAVDLAQLTRDVLVERFDPETMEQQFVYPMVWDEDPDELGDEVADAAIEVIDLYRTAAANNHAVIAAIQ